tara:strand:+ start:2461 stop:3198 length:738 start_codon:yes stop_codon:yes gene_type:complete
MRLDIYLKEKLGISRHKAQELILAEKVLVNQQVQAKPAYMVQDSDKVDVDAGTTLQFVSRAGWKLENALLDLNLNVEGAICLDLGQSTGGFSDCLLQRGAKKVFGVEVGHSQLHKSLHNHPRLYTQEKQNVKELSREQVQEALGAMPDWLVSDLSFISTLSLLAKMAEFMTAETQGIVLIKPQFELGAEHLNKQGVVKTLQAYERLQEEVEKSCQQAGLEVLAYIPAKPKGRDGNQEFILHIRKG